MFLIQDRTGSISLFRVSLVLGAIGILFLIGGIVSFSFDQESRRSPLEIPLPDNAEFWGTTDYSEFNREVFYLVPGEETIDAVVDHYQNEMANFYPVNSPEACQRNPRGGTFNDYEEGTGTVPYLWRCMFDNSSFNAVQWTQVTIHPGVTNPDDPNLDSDGHVVIIYEQRWES